MRPSNLTPTHEPKQVRTLPFYIFLVLSIISSLGASWNLVESGLEKKYSFVSGSDLQCIYIASKLYWIQHKSPYEKSEQIAFAAQDGTLNTFFRPKDYGPFLYNPLAVLMIYPFHYVEFNEAKAITGIWNLAWTLGIGILVWQLLSSYIHQKNTRMGLAFCCALLPASVGSMGNGQINNTPIAFFLLLGLFFYMAGKKLPIWYWVLAIFFISIKVQYLIMLLPFVMIKRNWPNLVWVSLTMCAILGVYYWFEPEIFEYYKQALVGNIEGGNMALSPQMLSNMMRGSNWALSGLVKRLEFLVSYTFGEIFTIHQVFPYYTLSGLIVLGGIFLLNLRAIIKQQWEPSLAMTILGLWAFSFGPVSWWHYLIFLFPLVLLSSLRNPGYWSSISLLLLGFINVLTLIQKYFIYEFPMTNSLSPGAIWLFSNSIFGLLMLILFFVSLLQSTRSLTKAINR